MVLKQRSLQELVFAKIKSPNNGYFVIQTLSVQVRLTKFSEAKSPHEITPLNLK